MTLNRPALLRCVDAVLFYAVSSFCPVIPGPVPSTPICPGKATARRIRHAHDDSAHRDTRNNNSRDNDEATPEIILLGGRRSQGC
jgi:hypothetical protein